MRDKAIEYIQKAKNDGRPFLHVHPLQHPHYPLHAPEEILGTLCTPVSLATTHDRHAHRHGRRHRQILDELERLDLFDNTCIFFQPDHGPSREPRNWTDGTDLPYPGGDTGGLRGHKGTLWEGGIRVPTLMSWPARVQGGKPSTKSASAWTSSPPSSPPQVANPNNTTSTARTLSNDRRQRPSPHGDPSGHKDPKATPV